MATATNDKALPIAITMGDPAGVGPEIIARVLGDADAAGALGQTPWILVGAPWCLAKGADSLYQHLPSMPVITHPRGATPGWSLLDLGVPEPADFRFG